MHDLPDPLQALGAARGPREAVMAVESLRGGLWERMLAALHEPSAGDVAELADRLARMCSALLGAALPGASPALAGGPPRREGEPDASFLDELRSTAIAASAPDAAAGPTRARSAQAPQAPPPHSSVRGSEIRLTDERASANRGADAPWIEAIAGELQHFQREHRPFAVLLVQLRDIERLRRALAPPELERLSATVERALGALLAAEAAEAERAERRIGASPPVAAQRPIAQAPGRYWLIAAPSDGPRARALALRIAQAVPAVWSADGSSEGALVGIALCPANARSADALAAHAEVDLYASRAPLPAPA